MARERNTDPKGELRVEEALDRLEEIVRALEDGEISLEESLQLFEEGVRLADALKKRLEESELRVRKVLEEAEGFRLEDFDL
jgi:exodeoxyribonuclease VII small subunit